MKFKIGDEVIIVKVNDPSILETDYNEIPETYIGQMVKIKEIDTNRTYPYAVEYVDDFKGDINCEYWEEDELDYASKETREQIIWDKLKFIANDIKKLKETPEYELKQILYMIEEHT